MAKNKNPSKKKKKKMCKGIEVEDYIVHLRAPLWFRDNEGWTNKNWASNTKIYNVRTFYNRILLFLFLLLLLFLCMKHGFTPQIKKKKKEIVYMLSCQNRISCLIKKNNPTIGIQVETFKSEVVSLKWNEVAIFGFRGSRYVLL